MSCGGGGIRWGRGGQVILRPPRIAAMGVVPGGVAMGGDARRLRAAILAKLALLGVGNLCPGARLEWYLATTVVAPIGSHLPGTWRHYSLLRRRLPE